MSATPSTLKLENLSQGPVAHHGQANRVEPEISICSQLSGLLVGEVLGERFTMRSCRMANKRLSAPVTLNQYDAQNARPIGADVA